MRFEGTVEIKWVDPMDPVKLGAPLHGPRSHIPKPTSGVRQGFSLFQASLDLCQAGLGEALLGDVAHNHDRIGLTASTANRTHRQRDGHGHPVGTQDLGLEVVDGIPRPDRGDGVLHVPPEMFGEQKLERTFEHVAGLTPKQPLRGSAPCCHQASRIHREDGVI
jgi:hypothetical protein